MKVSYQWLSTYIDIQGITAEQLAEHLTRSGIEVDAVESRNQGVENVVVGYVKSCQKHPEADKLSICQVDVGQSQDLQIVCGAKNIATGQKVPVAVVGAKLPGGLKIDKAKLRGTESQGMICSAKELGLPEKLLPKEQQEGIYVLPADTLVGTPIIEVLGLEDSILELDLTPNRSDCLSMTGVAYELAAILGKTVQLPSSHVSNGGKITGQQTPVSSRIQVHISAKEDCAHYAARYIQGVKIAPSPLWLQHRLIAAGIRPINNVVDVTNFVMLEYGQPLHAFDADQIQDGYIDVRFASPGEKLVTLDGVERLLEPHMLVIADRKKPIALAGVMGGLDTEVTSQTKHILLESAHFHGGLVRKTSRQLGLRSEASLRFEKEVNREGIIPALDRAAELIAQYSGGTVVEGIAEMKTASLVPMQIDISLARINDYLGTALTSEHVSKLFAKLHFTCETLESGQVFRVVVPKRRGDISRDVDLIEEIARLYGYDQIPTTLMSGITTPGSLSKSQLIRRLTRQFLTQQGLHEVITYSLTAPTQTTLAGGLFPTAHPITLALPMSEERSALRNSLLPHLIEVARYNRNRNQMDVAIFEIGKAYVTEESLVKKLPEEKMLLSILLTGHRYPTQWSESTNPADFFDVKGILELWLSYLGVGGVKFVASSFPGFHPGRCAEIRLSAEGMTSSEARDEFIGVIGQLHPDVQKEHDLSDTYVLELQIAPILSRATQEIDYKPLPRFPAIVRDIALVIDEKIPVAEMEKVIRQIAGEWLESLDVFDVYQGKHVGEGRKSVAFSMIFRHNDRTLLDEEVVEIQSIVVNQLLIQFGAELRRS